MTYSMHDHLLRQIIEWAAVHLSYYFLSRDWHHFMLFSAVCLFAYCVCVVQRKERSQMAAFGLGGIQNTSLFCRRQVQDYDVQQWRELQEGQAGLDGPHGNFLCRQNFSYWEKVFLRNFTQGIHWFHWQCLIFKTITIMKKF